MKEHIIAVWPKYAYEEFKNFIYSLNIEEPIKDLIIGKAVDLVQEAALEQYREIY